jgi:outer membrane protein OmpA-like peptidoglycan-associated protein
MSPIRMTEVRFAVASASLTASTRESLDALIASLHRRGSSSYLEVRGHADALGSWADNRRLAARRAEAVRAYLHRHGKIALSRIGVSVFSESVPAAADDTPEGRARNRRVVIVALQ